MIDPAPEQTKEEGETLFTRPQNRFILWVTVAIIVIGAIIWGATR